MLHGLNPEQMEPSPRPHTQNNLGAQSGHALDAHTRGAHSGHAFGVQSIGGHVRGALSTHTWGRFAATACIFTTFQVVKDCLFAGELSRSVCPGMCAPNACPACPRSAYTTQGLSGEAFWRSRSMSVFGPANVSFAALRATTDPASALMEKLPGAPVVIGRRLDGTVDRFFERARDAREQWAKQEFDRQRRREDVALCAIDILQNFCYIGYSLFFIKAASINCPDVTSCPVDIFNVIASFSWAVLFLGTCFADCPLQPFARAGCARDVSQLVAVTANLVASVLSLGTDCRQR